ncbi:MAG: galactose mutarotase [Treponema sp.]|nr:galactose mutarotase [Treponema sp.]
MFEFSCVWLVPIVVTKPAILCYTLAMKMSRKTFGVLSNGKKAHLYVLKAGDITFCLTNLGAAWTSLLVPSKNGRRDDVLLGFSNCDGYLHNGPYLGVTVGRFANRIGGAHFALNGTRYNLDRNDGNNTLHGGFRGFDKQLWKADAYEENEGVFVRFELDSPGGDSGFPGRLKAVVSYGLTRSNEIIASYEASADAPTPVNFTNHAYFNLAGEGRGSILSHEVSLGSSSYVEIDSEYIPTGRLIPVRGTPFDFRTRKPIKQDMRQEFGGSGGPDAPEGYDHCFSIDGDHGKLRPCAEVYEPDSGRTIKVFTTQPGVQFYTGNMLTGIPGKTGSVYSRHTGFCLETGHFPDSPNKSNFPSCIFGPGNDYHEKTVFAFGTE